MRKIILHGIRGTGKFALVDEEDFDKLNKYRWGVDRNGYARTDHCFPGEKGEKVVLKMHRFVMNYPKDKYVDHISGDKLDNRKCNLRICSHGQNRMNSKINKNNTTGFKGVRWVPHRQRYAAYVGVDGRRIYIISTETVEEAAYIRDQAAIQLQGEFAQTTTL